MTTTQDERPDTTETPAAQVAEDQPKPRAPKRRIPGPFIALGIVGFLAASVTAIYQFGWAGAAAAAGAAAIGGGAYVVSRRKASAKPGAPAARAAKAEARKARGILGLLAAAKVAGQVRRAARSAGGGGGTGGRPGSRAAGGGKAGSKKRWALGGSSPFGRSTRGGGGIGSKPSGKRAVGKTPSTGRRPAAATSSRTGRPTSGKKTAGGLFGRSKRPGGSGPGGGSSRRGGSSSSSRRGGGGSMRRSGGGLGKLFSGRKRPAASGGSRPKGPGRNPAAPKQPGRARRAVTGGRAFLSGLRGKPAKAGTPAAARRSHAAGSSVNRVAKATGRSARAIGRGARKAATSRPARWAGRQMKRAAAPVARRAVSVVRQPARGVRQRGRLWRRAASIARNRWQQFLKGAGLHRSPAYRRATAIASDGWTDFLLGTGLLDPDSPRWDATPDDATPGGKPITTPTAEPAAGQPARRAALPLTGGIAMSRPGSEKVQVLPPILEGAQEAFQQACDQFHCVNTEGELSANAARQLLQEMVTFIETLGESAKSVGEKVAEEIYLEPGAADVFHQIGDYFSAPAEDIAEAAQAVDQYHEDDVRRFENDDERTAAWDYKPNRIGY